MATLDELLHPITPERFLAEHHDRKPLHIPAGDDDRKRRLLDWSAFNGLLNQSGAWTAATLRLVREHASVPPSDYCQTHQTYAGQLLRPVPAKVQVLLSTGASLVANNIQQMHPPVTDLAATLGSAFAAQVEANVYCSFKGVQALGTHFDNHHVFAVQTEGEKTWNLYQNRAEHPVDLPPDTAESRRWAQQSRGPLMAQVVMRPGDVLYLPRGWYHDALASDLASLHVTLSVTPLYGRILLSLLDNAAMQNPAFRAYLPPAHLEGGEALRRRLAELGQLLASLAASPDFLDEVAMTQERLVLRPAAFDLPNRPNLTFYSTTNVPLTARSTQAVIVHDWIRQQGRFALEDLVSQFDFVAEADIRVFVAEAEKTGALRRV